MRERERGGAEEVEKGREVGRRGGERGERGAEEVGERKGQQVSVDEKLSKYGGNCSLSGVGRRGGPRSKNQEGSAQLRRRVITHD